MKFKHIYTIKVRVYTIWYISTKFHKLVHRESLPVRLKKKEKKTERRERKQKNSKIVKWKSRKIRKSKKVEISKSSSNQIDK